MPSAPTTQWMNIILKQGDDHPILIPVLEGNLLVDVTGWTARAQARESENVLLYTWSTDDGSAICDSTGVTLLTDDSTSWEWNYAHFDVVVVSPDEVHRVPAQGIIQVQRLWTQP